MKVNLYPDSCSSWQFYRDWIPGKDLACFIIGEGKFNATARNRMNFAVKQGYTLIQGWDHRNNHLKDLYNINTSAKIRQGREMSPAYFEEITHITIVNTCDRHYIEWFGIIDKEGALFAYSEVYFMGEIANISRFLGHAQRVKDGIMLLLTHEIITFCEAKGIKVLIYNFWISGTMGLQYFKHSTGFKSETLII